MKLHTLLGLMTIGVAVAACNKSYDTRPSLTLKSVNPSVVQVNQPLSISLEFTDKQGDFSSIWVKKTRVNLQTTATLRDTFPIPLSTSAPNISKGTIDVNLEYNSYLISASNPPTDGQGKPIPDTLIISLVLRDKAGNASDTVQTGKIVVLR